MEVKQSTVGKTLRMNNYNKLVLSGIEEEKDEGALADSECGSHFN